MIFFQRTSKGFKKKFILVGLVMTIIGLLMVFLWAENSSEWNVGSMGYLSFILYWCLGLILFGVGTSLILYGCNITRARRYRPKLKRD
jgi:hypothetical protein